MPTGFPGRTCRHCGVNERDGVVVSSLRRCENCAQRRLVKALNELAAKKGETWDKRLAGYERYVERLKGNTGSPVRSAKKRRRSAA